MSSHLRDWRQLARLTEVTEAEVGFSFDPVLDIIRLWSSKSNYKAEAADLVKYLTLLGKWDDIKDVRMDRTMPTPAEADSFINKVVALQRHVIKARVSQQVGKFCLCSWAV